MKKSELKGFESIDDLPEAIKELLFKMHTHAELCDPEEIVYKESDLLAILSKII